MIDDPTRFRCQNPLAGLWLLYCALATLLGWGLSALGFLNGWGYLAGMAIGLASITVGTRGRALVGFRLRIGRRRFRRLLPALYLTVFAFALIGGILYPPSNYDALSYRLPRMLQWLAEERWHWIHTARQAMNTRGSVSEWIQMPFMLLTGSDRLLFLPNLVSYGLLPGLVFNILQKLGVARSVAWNWMWIFPSAYCFALQAGSIGNDLIGSALFLSAMSFALNARNSQQWGDFALAAIGMALATGVKPSNAPLVLPWAFAVFPAIPLLWHKMARGIMLVLVSAAVSFVPTAFLNHKYCGDWTGMAAEPVMMQAGSPWLRISWNIPYLVIQNLTPPVFPLNSKFNREMEKLIPDELKGKLATHFQPEAATLHIPELMMEENGPLGLGILALLIVGAAGGLMIPGKSAYGPSHFPRLRRLPWIIFTCTLVALIPILVRSGMTGSGRYLAPYYLFLIVPFFPSARMSRFLQSRIWKTSVILCFGALYATMISSPARPMWPVLTFLNSVRASESTDSLFRRTWDVYTIYRQRPDAFAPIRRLLPAGVDRVGFISGNTPEFSLWKPLGSRRIIHVLPTDSMEMLRERGISYIVAGERTIKEDGFPEFTEWSDKSGVEIIATEEFAVMARLGSETWHLLKIRDVSDD
jgi:hypothetical protein